MSLIVNIINFIVKALQMFGRKHWIEKWTEEHRKRKVVAFLPTSGPQFPGICLPLL